MPDCSLASWSNRLATVAPVAALLAAVLIADRSPASVVVDVPLTLAEQENELSLRVEAFELSDSDTTNLSGTAGVTLALELDQLGAEVVGIRFGGGRVAAADVDFDFRVLFLTVASLDGRDLSGVLETAAPGLQPVVGGAFAAADHRVLLDMGTFDVSGAATASIDLSTDPFGFALLGDPSIDLQLASQVGGLATYDVLIALPVDATVEAPINDTLSGTVEAEGDLLARGRFAVLLPVAGDGNGDQLIDIADYALLRDRGDTASLGLWRANFGSPAPVVAAAAAVPEPAAAALCAGLLLGTLLARSARTPAFFG